MISAAKPKIADYPFTTLEPNLGVVRIVDAEFVVADIPGLIEGAAEGKGLGLRFLRHIERARVLAYLIDLASDTSPQRQLEVLRHEVGEYRPELLERPSIVVGSRSDLIDEETLQEKCKDIEFDVVISAVQQTNLAELTGKMADAVRNARQEEPVVEGFIVHRPVAEGIRIEKNDDGSFTVHGRSAERAVALSDLTNLEALDYAHMRLKKLGVDKALAKAGAQFGDTVHIGSLSFEYEED